MWSKEAFHRHLILNENPVPIRDRMPGLEKNLAAVIDKALVRNARIRAILAANPIVIEAYWHTGKIILARQQEAAWGAKVIDRLAADLQEVFPDMSGLTRRNLFSMRAFVDPSRTVQL